MQCNYNSKTRLQNNDGYAEAIVYSAEYSYGHLRERWGLRINAVAYTTTRKQQIVRLIYEYQQKHAGIAHCKIRLQRNSIELHL
ncbi:hypothetical protein HBI24_071760 [Parastagonospora nodorum]|nr:hypothetical protein HBI24_071760 [Parastagonospora nodorum]